MPTDHRHAALAVTLILLISCGLLVWSQGTTTLSAAGPTGGKPAPSHSEAEQEQIIRALIARVETLEEQAQTDVQAEQTAAHRAIIAINILITLVVVIGAMGVFLGYRGLRDLRRVTRQIQMKREHTHRTGYESLV